ncbi:MAG: hypothetical protein GY858_09255 [Candidatus Omnitrophica bacterium]|nr:hypothetical protein [Candidatus Omnitrophota bacterium]
MSGKLFIQIVMLIVIAVCVMIIGKCAMYKMCHGKMGKMKCMSTVK